MSRYLPTPSKISKPFWDSCKAQDMKLQQCEDCASFLFYPVYVCPECASRKLNWTNVSGKGTVHTFTTADKSIFEDVEGALIVALIELEEGAMMTTNLVNVEPAKVEIGMAVKLCYRPASDDITLPAFEPGL